MPTIREVNNVDADDIVRFNGVGFSSLSSIDGIGADSSSSIVTTNLIHHLDAANSNSYSGS